MSQYGQSITNLCEHIAEVAGYRDGSRDLKQVAAITGQFGKGSGGAKIRSRRRIGHEEHAVQPSVDVEGDPPQGHVEQGEAVGGGSEAQEFVISADLPIGFGLLLFMGSFDVGSGLLMEVFVSRVEDSSRFNGQRGHAEVAALKRQEGQLWGKSKSEEG